MPGSTHRLWVDQGPLSLDSEVKVDHCSGVTDDIAIASIDFAPTPQLGQRKL